MQSYFKPSVETWSSLFSNQLKMTNQFLSDSANIISTPSAAESFVQQLIETLLGVWVRGQVTDKSGMAEAGSCLWCDHGLAHGCAGMGRIRAIA